MTPSQEYDEKASQEYAEKLAEDPSQFYDDEPEESKAAAKAAVNAAAGKVAVQAGAGADVAAQTAPTQKEIDAFLARMTPEDKNRVLVAHGVSPAAKKQRAPKGLYQTQCVDVMKKIKPSLKYILDKHKEQHRELYMLGLFVKDYTDAAPESDDHDAYKRWLTDNKESIGLKKQTRKSTGADNVSTMTLSDMTINDDEDESEDAGAGTGADTGAGSP